MRSFGGGLLAWSASDLPEFHQSTNWNYPSFLQLALI
jgi:hypothetical protein